MKCVIPHVGIRSLRAIVILNRKLIIKMLKWCRMWLVKINIEYKLNLCVRLFSLVDILVDCNYEFSKDLQLKLLY